MTPETTPKAETPTPDYVKHAQTALSVVIGFAAILTGTGFLIVKVYLARYTDVAGYNILPAQYVTAGILPWVFGLVTFGIGMSYYNRRLRRRIERRGGEQPARLVGVVAILVVSIVASLAYGLLIYRFVPHSLGGGVPSAVIIAFKDATSAQIAGLTADPAHNYRTETVLLLAEMTDGILVIDSNNGNVVLVKSELIAAVIDDQTLDRYVTPTATLDPLRADAGALAQATIHAEQTAAAAQATPLAPADLQATVDALMTAYHEGTPTPP